MTVTITWLDGGQSIITPVQSIRIIDATTVELQTYGNTPTINRRVARMDMTWDLNYWASMAERRTL